MPTDPERLELSYSWDPDASLARYATAHERHSSSLAVCSIRYSWRSLYTTAAQQSLGVEVRQAPAPGPECGADPRTLPLNLQSRDRERDRPLVVPDSSSKLAALHSATRPGSGNPTRSGAGGGSLMAADPASGRCALSPPSPLCSLPLCSCPLAVAVWHTRAIPVARLSVESPQQ
jgi:hypothetical protein